LNFGTTESSFPWLSFVFLVSLIREIRGIRGLPRRSVGEGGSYKSSAFLANEAPNITEYLGEWREMSVG